jgi:hypothetical protein
LTFIIKNIISLHYILIVHARKSITSFIQRACVRLHVLIFMNKAWNLQMLYNNWRGCGYALGTRLDVVLRDVVMSWGIASIAAIRESCSDKVGWMRVPREAESDGGRGGRGVVVLADGDDEKGDGMETAE